MTVVPTKIRRGQLLREQVDDHRGRSGVGDRRGEAGGGSHQHALQSTRAPLPQRPQNRPPAQLKADKDQGQITQSGLEDALMLAEVAEEESPRSYSHHRTGQEARHTPLVERAPIVPDGEKVAGDQQW